MKNDCLFGAYRVLKQINLLGKNGNSDYLDLMKAKSNIQYAKQWKPMCRIVLQVLFAAEWNTHKWFIEIHRVHANIF